MNAFACVGLALAMRSGPRYLKADAARLPLAHACLDRGMAASLLNLLPDARAALLERLRVLRPADS